MSVCRLGSARIAGAPIRAWASRTLTVTPQNSVFFSRRWNSSRTSNTTTTAKARVESATGTGRGRGDRAGWNTFSVVAVVSATAVLVYGYATSQANSKTAKERDYSSPAKFVAPKYADIGDMEAAIKEIRQATGDEDTISTDPEDLKAHGYSEWSSTNIDGLPVAVAYPKTTAEVSKIAKICYRYRVPIIPFSGGSSLEGNFSAPYGGVSVDFAYMDQILKLHEEDMDVVVQPSVSWMDLNEQLAKRQSGLFFPVDPGPSAKIGGMVGTNCSGTNAVRYGTMKDWVINLTVVLADGTVIKTKRRPRKTSAGYNLNSLFVGSEGTLGLVTEITLKLAVVPQEFSVAVVTFPSIRDAASAAAGVMRAASKWPPWRSWMKCK
ncbi:D-lactate ferricytochrome C oxidoreductase [Lachnellula arida]|uniref:D-lactate ferricytochrome C oxidoreductase n=1 Tax=Lachnellula arida TaxID=1316785 RepID=A0A8T9BNM6_9HELO|nr:D-lactate ferricytochrome C oxidoreductase [Lachnellula arida]